MFTKNEKFNAKRMFSSSNETVKYLQKAVKIENISYNRTIM